MVIFIEFLRQAIQIRAIRWGFNSFVLSSNIWKACNNFCNLCFSSFKTQIGFEFSFVLSHAAYPCISILDGCCLPSKDSACCQSNITFFFRLTLSMLNFKRRKQLPWLILHQHFRAFLYPSLAFETASRMNSSSKTTLPFLVDILPSCSKTKARTTLGALSSSSFIAAAICS